MKSLLQLRAIPPVLASPLPRQPVPLYINGLSSAQNSLNILRPLTTSSPNRSSAPSPAESQALTAHHPRWLSALKERIGTCICFGMNTAQVGEASEILKELSRDWRELVAGSEGYLTAEDRRGLWRHRVVWGEMVC
ncbi:hypothetical protein P152DRAFT_25632 [Eremomyces bilateralis CBS 781.70]|uniref:Uncharacterized protein n=1 Tax=Eremomyces bilateralis CBS 781.70 TaxID=1392243 RepID=A0A6G1GI65_9PEZI|nr:uncharacterized protein P152DRAFT_25632 [Eremomyces bilateralis CBS 781.70]KAF1817646.1 hypothetical protein P152DRAFT_25632 [Eremomyces bilateralis CBS 781.70]